MKRDWTADIIKIMAVITAAPRWIGALLAAEGLAIPATWDFWLPLSAILNAAMAVVEGLAFAYVFNAWRNDTSKRAGRLFSMALLSGVVFIIVGAPYIAAQVRDTSLSLMLSSDTLLWLWSASVFASTIMIIASVGYAQKGSDEATQAATLNQVVEQTGHTTATDLLLSYYMKHPYATPSDAEAQIGLSRQWIGKKLATLEKEGVIQRPDNGSGVKIIKEHAEI